MAFDIFIACMDNGKSGTFKRALAAEILGRDSVNTKDPLWEVEYRDGSGSCVYCAETEDIDGMMFNHSGGDTFFQRLWELADSTGSMIFWPDSLRSIAVTRSAFVQYLDEDIPERERPPFVVSNGKELQYAIGYGDHEPWPNAADS